jgi:DNA ligase-associated metallophosphoesterase
VNLSAAKNPLNQEPHQLTFARTTFHALLSGALYWPEEETLLVADLHLEKLSSFARSRQFLPPYDTKATLKRLQQDISQNGAKRVIALGDSFHRDEGTQTLIDDDLHILMQMTSTIDWVWIAGNHDPSVHQLGGQCCDEVHVAGLVLSHEPDGKLQNQVAGHLHPAAHVRINGRSARRACFVRDDVRMILPAYGVSTGSLNILNAAFKGVINRGNMRVDVLGKNQIYPVSPNHLIGR